MNYQELTLIFIFSPIFTWSNINYIYRMSHNVWDVVDMAVNKVSSSYVTKHTVLDISLCEQILDCVQPYQVFKNCTVSFRQDLNNKVKYYSPLS